MRIWVLKIIFAFLAAGLVDFSNASNTENQMQLYITWLLDLSNTSLEQDLRLKTLAYLLFILLFSYLLFGCPMNNFWLLLRKHSHSPNVNHCILVIFGAKLAGRYWASTPKWVPSKLWSQCHNPRSHSPQIVENSFARLAPSFYKMPSIPKIVIAWHCGGL